MKFEDQIIALIEEARHKTASAVNMAMVCTYFEIGRRIVEEEQKGASRANYGERLLERLARALTAKFGKGFSLRNVRNMRGFYLVYSQSSIRQTVSAESRFCLSWSHYLFLMRMDPAVRQFYEIESPDFCSSVQNCPAVQSCA